MSRPRKVILKEAELETAAQAHELLSRELEFPDHYGNNFDALADCLGDIFTPTRIVHERDAENLKPWFDVREGVVCECAQKSCYLGCTIRLV